MLKFIRILSILCCLLFCALANAMTWNDLWWRKDQQGMQQLRAGDPKQAAKTFESSSWRGVADYRAKDYAAAEHEFTTQRDVTSQYNLGNAYALQGKYQEAITAYENALKQQPKMADAIYNRDLIKKLLEQQKKQQQQEQKNENKSSKQDKQPQQSQEQNNSKDKQQANNEQNQKPNDSKNNSDKQEQKQENKQQQSAKNEQDNDSGKNKESEKSGNNKSEDQKKSEKQNKQDKQQQAENNEQNSKDNSDQQSKDPGQDHKSGSKLTHGKEDPSSHQKAQMAQEEMARRKAMDQETDQWLQQIPDDPGGLIRRKIMRDHLRRTNQTEEK